MILWILRADYFVRDSDGNKPGFLDRKQNALFFACLMLGYLVGNTSVLVAPLTTMFAEHGSLIVLRLIVIVQGMTLSCFMSVLST